MADYHLMAELIVPVENSQHFEELTQKFLDDKGFKSLDPEFDSKLVLGLKSEAPFPYQCYSAPQGDAGAFSSSAKEAPRKAYRYVNLWQLLDKDALDLADIMTRSADSDLYTKINAQVIREFQNFVLRVQWLKGVQVKADIDKVIRITRQFTTPNLGKYLFKAGTTFPFLQENGWFPLGHFQAITGALNTVTEFWQTKRGTHDPAHMRAALDGLPEGLKKRVVEDLSEAHYAEIRESFTRAPYDPTGGGAVY